MTELAKIKEIVADFCADSTNLKPWGYTQPTMEEWEELRQASLRESRDLEIQIRLINHQD